MPRLKLLEMDIDNKMIYFRKDDKLIAFDADVAIELISDSLDGNHVEVVRCKDCRFHNTHRCYMAFDLVATDDMDYCSRGERR